MVCFKMRWRQRQVTIVTMLIVISLLMFTIRNVANGPVFEYDPKDFHAFIAAAERLKLTTNVSKVTSDYNFMQAAKRVSEQNEGSVLVTFINDAYIPFAYSWLCNTKDMGIHDSLLLITTDTATKVQLSKDWPHIEVVSMNISSLTGEQVYSHAGYIKVMIRRTEMLLDIVLSDIELFLFEVDCVWILNPVPFVRRIAKGADIVLNPVSGSTMWAGGFLYLNPTVRGKELWWKLTQRMNKLGEKISSMDDDEILSEDDNDQSYLSVLIHERKRLLQYKVLPLELFADGKWYELSDAERRKKPKPLIINNNWVIGNEAKMERAKKWKHWFLREDMSCDVELVKKTVSF